MRKWLEKILRIFAPVPGNRELEQRKREELGKLLSDQFFGRNEP